VLCGAPVKTATAHQNMPAIQFPLWLVARSGKGPPPEWVPLLFLGASMLLAAIAVYLGLRVKKRLAHSKYAEGEVIRFLEQGEGRGQTSKAPVIRFTANDGTTHVVNSSVYSHPPAFEAGDKIQVVYPPDRPHEAEYVGLFAQWGGAMIAGGVSAALGFLVLCIRYL
jgi:hypothetical protein